MNNIESIVLSRECTGCCACVNICPTEAIKYDFDEYKFVVPAVDASKCVNCGKCLKTCPALKTSTSTPLNAYAALSVDLDLLMQCSSGGIFGALAKTLIQKGWVVYGCTMTESFKVKHIRVDNIKDLNRILRSKYVQSSLGNTYQNVLYDLKNNHKVLFSGTPCQVSALNNFIPDEYKSNLLTVDVVCHGIPSQAFFDSYLKNLEENKGKIQSYKFRAKRQPENGMSWFFSYKLKKHSSCTIKNWPEDTYNYMYMMSYIYRDSCYCCKYANIHRPGDITLGDYWGWEKFHNEFKKGSSVSAVIINSIKGEKYFKELRGLIIVPTLISNILQYNSCLKEPSKCPLDRKKVLDIWKIKGFAYLDKEYKKKTIIKRFKYRLMRILPQSVLNSLLASLAR